eukprot:jgi/Chlat1/6388/Chrsp44S05839
MAATMVSASLVVPSSLGGLQRLRSTNGKVKARTGVRMQAADAGTGKAGASVASLEAMRKFSEQYAKRSGTYFCVDKGVTAVVVQGLAEHRDSLGAPLCPCRHYDDKKLEAEAGFWNCPCVPMRERKECHCMLFLTEDNGFAGKEQSITLDEVQELSKSF